MYMYNKTTLITRLSFRGIRKRPPLVSDRNHFVETGETVLNFPLFLNFC